MKKLLIGLVAAMCCFALAAPAMAQVKISGMITFDAYYFDQDAERTNNILQGGTQGRDDRQTTNFELPQFGNRIDVQWTSEDKKVHGRIQLRFGAATATGFSGPGVNATFPQGTRPRYDMDPEFAYIDYHWTPNWYSRFGRQEQTFAIMAPSQTLGQAQGHIVGVGWGNIHGGTARDGIKNYFKFSDMVRLEVELIDPSNETAEAITGFTVAPGGNGAQIQEESTIPRIDAALNIKIANFVIEPSVTYLQQKYKGLAAGEEDSIDIWGGAVGVSAGFGPFKIAGEAVYGQNLGNANYVGGNGTAIGFLQNGNNHIEDTDVFAAWIDLGFDFGPLEIHGIVGYETWQTDEVTGIRGENDRERWMYGVNVPIKMTKNFTIKPEVVYYKDDDSAKTGRVDNLTTDFGSEIVAGVQFQLVF